MSVSAIGCLLEADSVQQFMSPEANGKVNGQILIIQPYLSLLDTDFILEYVDIGFATVRRSLLPRHTEPRNYVLINVLNLTCKPNVLLCIIVVYNSTKKGLGQV